MFLSIILHADSAPLPQLIHPDMRFDPNSNPPSFASEDQVRGSCYLLLSLMLTGLFTVYVVVHTLLSDSHA